MFDKALWLNPHPLVTRGELESLECKGVQAPNTNHRLTLTDLASAVQRASSQRVEPLSSLAVGGSTHLAGFLWGLSVHTFSTSLSPVHSGKIKKMLHSTRLTDGLNSCVPRVA